MKRFGAAAILSFLTLCLAARGAETAFDDDGTILVNGERTLIIGSYHVGNRYTQPEPNAERFEELAKAGFNVVHASPTHFDAALAAGLMTWTSVGTLDLENRAKSEEELRARVSAVRNHPSMAFLETVDEPAWTWMKAEARVPAEALAEAYPIIKSVDANHLLYTNHAPTNLVKTLRAYNAGTDIVACDIYPVNPGGLKHQYALFEDGYQGDLNNTTISQVGEYVDKMRRVTGPDRPLFMVLQAFAWEMLTGESERRQEKILYPTYKQQRFMAYQSLIKGANGIMYWGSYYTPQPSQAWSDLTRVTRELRELEGPLIAPTQDLELTVEYHEIGHSMDDGVQWSASRYKDDLYLFTCNAYRYPAKATLAGLDGWKQCDVLHEDRTVEIENGEIIEYWQRFDVHVYRFSR